MCLKCPGVMGHNRSFHYDCICLNVFFRNSIWSEEKRRGGGCVLQVMWNHGLLCSSVTSGPRKTPNSWIYLLYPFCQMDGVNFLDGPSTSFRLLLFLSNLIAYHQGNPGWNKLRFSCNQGELLYSPWLGNWEERHLLFWNSWLSEIQYHKKATRKKIQTQCNS
jgi:hypothetical protein